MFDEKSIHHFQKKYFPKEEIVAKLEEIVEIIATYDSNITESLKYQFSTLRNPIEQGIFYSENGAAKRAGITNSIIISNTKEDLSESNTLIIVNNSQLTFYKLMQKFFEKNIKPDIHPTAIIANNASIGNDVYIGPYCVIGNALIGDNVSLNSHVCIMDNSMVESDVSIDSGTIIGASGMVWSWEPEHDQRVMQPQIGATHIKKASIIGSNVSIARGSVNEVTTIGENVVIAHGSMIGHGGNIGEKSHLANNVTIAGNVTLGKKCFMGSGSVIRPNIKLGCNNVVGAGAVVVKDNIKENQVLTGVPAKAKKRDKTRLSGVSVME